MNQRKVQHKNVIICIVFGLLLGYQIYQLFVTGPYRWSVTASEEARKMFIELFSFCALISTINFVIKGKLKIYLGIILLALAAYFHQTIIPLCISVGYFILIIMVGAGIMFLLFKKAQVRKTVFWLGSLLLGLNFVCITVGILSICNKYSVKNVLLCLVVVGILGLASNRKKICNLHYIEDNSKKFNLFLSCIEISILIQIGRVGLQGDHDALWYGIRSPYVLANSSKGIYEDLHLVGFVYLYPKGFETILLPFSKFGSWNYQFLFNQILVIVIVMVSWKFVAELANKDFACVLGAVIATLPCLTNMGMTVKPDVITVLFQISAMFFVYLFSKENNVGYLSLALTCLISSYCFKITSLLFTSVICIAMIPFMVSKKIKSGMYIYICRGISYGFLTLGIIWGRTFALTGSPLIAFVGSILTKLGIEPRYPYSIVGGINHQSEQTVFGIGKSLLNTLYGYYLNPVAEGFDHISIAWGTSIPGVLLILAGIIFVSKKTIKNYRRWLWLIGCLCISMLFGMAFITQADGNYFLLFYILFIILAGSFVLKNTVGLSGLLYMATVFNIVFMSVSSWSWSNGFTPIKLVNKGYVNQQNEYDERLMTSDGENIYGILNGSQNNRIVAVTSDYSKLVGIKCIVESWYDISVSNSTLVSDAISFYQYCNRCGIDYIYVDYQLSSFNAYAEELLIDLIKAGRIEQIIYGENSAVFVVNSENNIYEHAQKLADEYLEKRMIVRSKGWYEDGWAGPEVEIFVFSETGNVVLNIGIPYEINESLNADVYVNDLQVSTVNIDENSTQYLIEVPKGEYTKISIRNHFYKEVPTDSRQLCYILNVSKTEYLP